MYIKHNIPRFPQKFSYFLKIILKIHVISQNKCEKLHYLFPHKSIFIQIYNSNNNCFTSNCCRLSQPPRKILWALRGADEGNSKSYRNDEKSFEFWIHKYKVNNLDTLRISFRSFQQINPFEYILLKERIKDFIIWLCENGKYILVITLIQNNRKQNVNRWEIFWIPIWCVLMPRSKERGRTRRMMTLDDR